VINAHACNGQTRPTTFVATLSAHRHHSNRYAGVQLKTATATAALTNFKSLARLDMSRCRLEPAAIAALASSVPSLQNLNLASCALSKTFTELQALQQLSSLTKLDLSSNALGPADADHVIVCSMTQLRHLALNCVVMDRK
jgi:Ran GTPase-activating protein (RanGAP) involved in mRNA processing and transport